MKSILLIFLFSFPVFIYAQEWELKKEDNGIKVFTRLMEGEKLKETKATMVVNGDINNYLAILTKVENYTDWIYECISAKKLKINSDSAFIYYGITNAPWPVNDRDYVIKSTTYTNKKTGVVSVKSTLVKDLVELKNGLVRINSLADNLSFKPLKNNEIEINYWLKINPGGSVPYWLLNLFATIGPYQTLYRMREQVEIQK